MSNDDFSNEDFDSLFNNSNSNSDSGSLTATQRREMEKIASEQLIRGYQALQQGQAVVQQMTQEALRKTEQNHPGFIKRYQDPETCRKFIEQRPAVARAILNAESGQGTDSLPELYDIFAETAGTYEQPNRGSGVTPTPASNSASVLSLQQINRRRCLSATRSYKTLGTAWPMFRLMRPTLKTAATRPNAGSSSPLAANPHNRSTNNAQRKHIMLRYGTFATRHLLARQSAAPALPLRVS